MTVLTSTPTGEQLFRSAGERYKIIELSWFGTKTQLWDSEVFHTALNHLKEITVMRVI
jgi:hypothetical protein